MSANGGRTAGTWWTVYVTTVILGILGAAGALHEISRDIYYLSVQEDEFLEWASFWSFAAAGVLFFLAAVLQRRAERNIPWFFGLLAIFCIFVAGEEISWGQRLLGYRPPDYFLAENFQQELNVHNIVKTSYRKLTLLTVIAGYGILLPLLPLAPPLGKAFRKAAVVAPPLNLLPSFLAIFIFYKVYPWKFSGEVAELMLGFGFLFAAVAGAGRENRRIRPLVVSTALVIVLSLTTMAVGRWARDVDPEFIALTERETELLREDFLALKKRNRGRSATRCGLHKRIYTFVGKYKAGFLREGSFAEIVAGGVPEERVEFFLDPWNSPYWIRDKCDRKKNRRRIFVYSFGPNRRRDSTPWEIRGDDIGAVIFSMDE